MSEPTRKSTTAKLLLAFGVSVLARVTARTPVNEPPEITTTPPAQVETEQPQVEEETEQLDASQVIELAERAVSDKSDIYTNGCYRQKYPTNKTGCVYGDPDSSQVVYLVGDSHSAQWVPALAELAVKNSWQLVVRSKPSCTFSVGEHSDDNGGPYPDCSAWYDEVSNEIATEAPTLVITSNHTRHPMIRDGVILKGDENEAELTRVLRETWQTTATSATPLIGIKNTPFLRFNTPECLIENASNPNVCAVPVSEAIDVEPRPDVAAASGLENVSLIDMNE